MDLMALLNAQRYSPEETNARRARSAARRAALEAVLPDVLGHAGGAGGSGGALDSLGWNIFPHETGTVLGGQHPGAAALGLVRRAMDEFHVPSVNLRFVGMKRTSGHSAFAMDEGVVTIEAALQSLSGPKHYVDIPVVVHAGRALMPSILFHEGSPRVLAQSTFDDIIGRGEFRANIPDRKNMFSPPPDKDVAAAAVGGERTMPLVRPSMFSTSVGRAFLRGAASDYLPPFNESLHHEDWRGELVPLLRTLIEAGWGDVISEDMEVPLRRFEEEDAPESEVAEWILNRLREYAQTYACTACDGAGGEGDIACRVCGGYGIEPHDLSKEAAGTFGGEGAGVFQRVDPLERQVLEELRQRNLESFMFPESSTADPEMLKYFLKNQDERLNRMLPKMRDPLGTEDLPPPSPPPVGRRRTPPSPSLSTSYDPDASSSTSYEPDVTRDLGVPLDVPIVEGKPLRKPRPRSAAATQSATQSAKTVLRRILRAFYEPDVVGLRSPGLGRDVPGADGSHIDVGERMPVGTFTPGQKVKTKREHVVRDRGGVRYTIPKGEAGVVVRDYDGADYAYVVRFPQFAVKMPREALT